LIVPADDDGYDVMRRAVVYRSEAFTTMGADGYLRIMVAEGLALGAAGTLVLDLMRVAFGLHLEAM